MRLPKYVTVHRTYGLKALRERFVNKLFVSQRSFSIILGVLSTWHTNSDNILSFVEEVECYHLRIVESLYMLTSVTRDIQIISESVVSTIGLRVKENHKI